METPESLPEFRRGLEQIIQIWAGLLDQVWSILPALELLPLHCSRGVISPGRATKMQAKWIKLDILVCSDKGKPEMVLGLHQHYKNQMLGFLRNT